MELVWNLIIFSPAIIAIIAMFMGIGVTMYNDYRKETKKRK